MSAAAALPQAGRIYAQDCVSFLRSLPDKSVDMILTDPPYYRVKGEFDFVWEYAAAYLKDARGWAEEMARVLRPQGALVWFTSDKMLARVTVMLEEWFTLLNSCTIVKKNGMAAMIQNEDTARKFIPNDERFVYMCPNGAEYCDDNPAVMARNACRYQEGMLIQRLCRPLRDYLDGERKRAGVSVKEICEALGVESVAGHWFTEGSQWYLPTRENYEKMRAFLNSRPHGDYLRKEYDDLRRPFSMENRQSDVWTVTVDGGLSARLGHPTPKPLPLIRSIIRQTTRPGQLVCDPFMGSGTTAVACKMENRRYTGCDMSAEYVAAARRRVEETQPGFGI